MPPRDGGGETTTDESDAADNGASDATGSAATDSAAATVPAFEFTPEADENTFFQEANEYLETVEITPELRTILNRYEARAQSAETALGEYDRLGDRQATGKTMTAFNQLLSFRQDEASGEFVPDTTAVVDLLKTDYPGEYKQFVIDLNAQPLSPQALTGGCRRRFGRRLTASKSKLL